MSHWQQGAGRGVLESWLDWHVEIRAKKTTTLETAGPGKRQYGQAVGDHLFTAVEGQLPKKLVQLV